MLRAFNVLKILIFFFFLGDEADYWMDIAECLIAKNIINVIVSTTETSSVASDRMQNITNLQNITVTREKDISILLNSAQKLAPISAIFVIRMVINSKIQETFRYLFSSQCLPGS